MYVIEISVLTQLQDRAHRRRLTTKNRHLQNAGRFFSLSLASMVQDVRMGSLALARSAASPRLGAFLPYGRCQPGFSPMAFPPGERPPMTPGADPPETSIVVRTFNEERWLPELLAAIDRQRYRAFEVLVVDSGSVDRTRDIAEARGARVIRIRPEDFTFGFAINAGIRESRGRFIVIVSAHCIPLTDHWLERLVAPLQEPEVAMVFGGQRGHGLSKFSEARDFERVFPAHPVVMDDDHVFVSNANAAIRKDLWELHSFDEGLPGLEDAEWAKYWIPRGKQVRYDPEASVSHIHTESWDQIRHRFHREGVAGRWTAVRIMRHIPREIWREFRWTVWDLALAAWQRRFRALAGEIVRYRYHKAAGLVGGILDSRSLDNPSRRAELYFEQSFPALVIRGPHQASLEQRSIPTLRPGEVLIRVAYQGICATDLEVLEGRLGYYKTGLAKYPIVPGHESSGTVAAIGTRVTAFREGDRVVVECIQGCGTCPECLDDRAITCRQRGEVGVMGVDGGYAKYLITRARYVHKVPEGVSLRKAALAEPLAVVLKGLRRLGAISPGSEPRQCAVVGGGTIGQLSARVLAGQGHRVTVFDREPHRLANLNGNISGATQLSNLEQYDWLIEATGDPDALNAALSQSRTGASLLLFGFPYATTPFSFESLVGFDKAVVGTVGSTGADFEEALRMLTRLDLGPFLTTSFGLDEYRQAWAAVRSRAHLKVMLRVDPDAD